MVGPLPAPARPYAAGLLRSGQIVLRKQPGHEASLSLRLALSNLQYASNYLPHCASPASALITTPSAPARSSSWTPRLPDQR